MPPLPEAIILVLAPFTPLFSHRVWLHAQLLLLGAILAPGAPGRPHPPRIQRDGQPRVRRATLPPVPASR
jgi:hypothetical protein